MKEKNRAITIDNVRIGDDSACYVIAEIGHNHQGDVEQAKKLILAAKNSGANAVKLQKRSNRDLFTAAYYNRPYNSENSFGQTYGEHREFLEFERNDYIELQYYSRQLGITFFATAFDFQSAELLASLDVPMYKIASGDLTNIPLIKYVASFGKPILLSTGGGTIDDVDRAVECLSELGVEFCMMQCTAGYPPAWEELNLSVIRTFLERYPDVVIGFSSHDNGIAMAVAAYVLGARVIEKHFTLNRTLKGTDHAFSLEPQGLAKMIRDLRRLEVALGDGEKCQYPSERDPLMKMGKKLVVARDIRSGSVLADGDIVIKSPGNGLPPYMLDVILGKRVLHDLKEDEDLVLENLAN